MSTSPSSPAPRKVHRTQIGGIVIDAVSEREVLELVESAWARQEGGIIITPNIDIWRLAARDHKLAELIERARVVVADGMPLVWASKIAGDPLPERVTGSGLVELLSNLAARRSKAVYIIGGGANDSARRAAAALSTRYEGLSFVGMLVPPFGFESDSQVISQIVDEVADAVPDLVLVGLGFPKQEQLAEMLLARLPAAWFLGCGGGIQMAAGDIRRAPRLAQRIGAEWIVRLLQEPHRLTRRYLVDDAPAALRLLGWSVAQRFSR